MVKIDSIKFGEIEIDGKTYYSDVVVWWTGDIEIVEKRHIIDVDDISKLLKKDPKIIIIGTGQGESVKLLPEVREVLENKGIKLYVETSPNAIEIFNSFVVTKKKVVAFIHTTC